MSLHHLAEVQLSRIPKGSVWNQLKHCNIGRILISPFNPPPLGLLFVYPEKCCLQIALPEPLSSFQKTLSCSHELGHTFSFAPDSRSPLYPMPVRQSGWAGLTAEETEQFCDIFGALWLRRGNNFEELLSLLQSTTGPLIAPD